MISQPPPIYLVDALHLLFRSYYAIGAMSSPAGESTGALYGFIRTINAIRKKHRPSFLAIIFDGEGSNQTRKALYPLYKSQRKAMPSDFSKQVREAIEFCRLAPIPYLAVPNVEADDVIGSISTWASAQDLNTFIISTDKDLCQLITSQVTVLSPQGQPIGPEDVYQKYGVYPQQIVDFLSLTGDRSDNIPGVKGFGPKTAARLLNKHNLDELLTNPQRMATHKILSSKEQIITNRQLLTIDRTIRIPTDISFYRTKKKYSPAIRNFYEQKHFVRLLKDIDPTPLKPPRKKVANVISSLKTLERTLSDISGPCAVAIYPEKYQASIREQRVAGIAISDNPYRGFYIPFNASLSRSDLLQILRKFMTRKDIDLLGHNLHSQLHLFHCEQLPIPPLAFDTLIAAQLLSPHRLHTLESLLLDNLDIAEPYLPKTDPIEIAVEQLALIAATSAEHIFQLSAILSKSLAEQEMLPILKELDLPIVKELVAMERREIHVDQAKLKKRLKAVEQQIEKLTITIQEHTSPSYSLSILERGTIWEKIKSKKKEKLSLEEIALLDHHLTSIFQYSLRLKKVVQNGQIVEKDPRIYWQTNRLGKIECRKPDLNVLFSKEAFPIAETLCPLRGQILLADYNQLEMRLLAHFSEDPRLLHSFALDEDIHSTMAADLYHTAPARITEQMRVQAKAIHFAVLDALHPQALAYKLQISVPAAQSLIDTFERRHPRVKQFLEEHLSEVRKQEVSITLGHRKRFLPEINSYNPTTRHHSEQLAISWLIAGSAVDILKKGFLVARYMPKNEATTRLLAFLRNSLVIELGCEATAELPLQMKDHLEKVYPLRVPLVIQIAVGRNWAECYHHLVTV